MEQLTNYELLDLFVTYAESAGSHFMNFMTMFSAYLVAGYLLADRLRKSTLVLISILYTFVILMPAMASFMVLLTAIDIGTEVSARQLVLGENSALVAKLVSGSSGGFMKYSNPVLQLIAYVGSVVFVFHIHAQATEKRALEFLNETQQR